jgi:hypothetical protein
MNSKFELAYHILIMVGIVLLIILAIIMIGGSLYQNQILHNQCVMECVKINQLNPNSCVC